MEIFLSYAHEDRESARILADVLSALGHQPWLDQKRRGGQAWWDEILAQLRSSDLYVYLLSPAAIKSRACEAELNYASALRRPLLLVKVRQVSANVLPRPFAQAHYVDYTSADKQAAFELAAVLAEMPAETPLPKPLPSEPKLPRAPLHEAKARIDSTSDLTRAEQLDLLDRLRSLSQLDDQREDARDLLVQLRNRPDIFADVRDKIDAALAQVGKPSLADISAGGRGPRPASLVSSSAAGIFISYRREEATAPAAHLYDKLSDRLGEERVFMDVDSIGLGLDFVEAVSESLSSCEVLLALIGPRWLELADESGRRRIDDPTDFVRLELQTALERDNVRVVPVLVSGAALPPAEELPHELEGLVRRQALELRDATFRNDASRLVEQIGRIVGVTPSALARFQGGEDRAPGS